MVRVGIRAQRAEVGGRVWHADHGQWSGLVLTIEGRRMRGIERTAIDGGVGRVIEPEAKVESIYRCRVAQLRIKAKDLIQQDRLNGRVDFALAACLEIRLIPCEAEASGKGRINCVIRQQIGTLYGEHVERHARTDVLRRKYESVVKLAAEHCDASRRRRSSRNSKTAHELRIGKQIEVRNIGLRH